MDPDACLTELIDAVAAGDGQEAYDHADNLLMWLNRGGFAPGGGKLRLSSIRSFCNWVKSTYPSED